MDADRYLKYIKFGEKNMD